MKNKEEIVLNLQKAYDVLDFIEIKGKQNTFYMFNLMSLIKTAMDLLENESCEGENKKDE